MMIFSLRSIFELIREGVFYNRYVVYLEAGGRDRLLDQHREICEAIEAGTCPARKPHGGAPDLHHRFLQRRAENAAAFETARLREAWGFQL